MRKLVLCAAGVIAAAGLEALPRASAQSQAANKLPEFEVASVKPNKSGENFVRIQGPAGRFTATNVPVRLLIRTAYRLQDFQIVGGPAWLNTDRFDVVAKSEEGATQDQTALMLRALLADRFKLAVHNEMRELPIYALVPARGDGRPGPQLRPAAADCTSARGRVAGPPPGPPPAAGRPACGSRMAPGNIAAGGVTMATFAASLSQFVNRTVVDRTGLTGSYDLDLQWTPEQMPQLPPGAERPAFLPPIDPNGPSIFTAVQEQLGLKLDSQKGPVDVLVIDHLEQPTED
jgi:uncharacterized protein (TIGR03435 family)